MRLASATPYARVIRAHRQIMDGTATINRWGFLEAAPQPPFRSGETTRCTCCGASQWLVGRQSAECGVCGAPAILATPGANTHLDSQKG
jgi:hypothetical protein